MKIFNLEEDPQKVVLGCTSTYSCMNTSLNVPIVFIFNCIYPHFFLFRPPSQHERISINSLTFFCLIKEFWINIILSDLLVKSKGKSKIMVVILIQILFFLVRSNLLLYPIILLIHIYVLYIYLYYLYFPFYLFTIIS